MQRARRTSELAGFGDRAVVDDRLVEWQYGEYEGITTAETRDTIPDFTVWTHPCPGGETAAQVSRRLDHVVAKVRAKGGRVLALSQPATPPGARRSVDRAAKVEEGRLFLLRYGDSLGAGLRRGVPRSWRSGTPELASTALLPCRFRVLPPMHLAGHR